MKSALFFVGLSLMSVLNGLLGQKKSEENQQSEFVMDYPDLTVESIYDKFDEKFKLGAFKSANNDRILARYDSIKHLELSWVSLGLPKLIESNDALNKNSYLFHFNDSLFYTYIELLTNDYRDVLAQAADDKYTINIRKSQILQMRLTKVDCALVSTNPRMGLLIRGQVNDLNSFPLRLDFNEEFNSEKRIQLRQIVQRMFFEQKLNEMNELVIKCSIESKTGLNNYEKNFVLGFKPVQFFMSDFNYLSNEIINLKSKSINSQRTTSTSRETDNNDGTSFQPETRKTTNNWTLLRTLTGHSSDVDVLIVLSNGNLVSGSKDRTIRVWNPISGKLLRSCNSHRKEITALIEIDRNKIASASADQTINVLNVQTMQLYGTLYGHTNKVNRLLFMKNGLLASASDDNTVKIWDLTKFKLLKTFKHSDWVRCMVELNNGLLASGSDDKSIKIWNVSNGTLVKNLTAHSGGIWSLLSFDNWLISGSADSKIAIWNVDTWNLERILEKHTSMVNTLIKVNANSFASSSDDGTVKIWNKKNFNLIKSLEGHEDLINSILVLQSGEIASVSFDNSTIIWNPNNGEKVVQLKSHMSWIFSAVELKNGNLATCSKDKTIKIWGK